MPALAGDDDGDEDEPDDGDDPEVPPDDGDDPEVPPDEAGAPDDRKDTGLVVLPGVEPEGADAFPALPVPRDGPLPRADDGPLPRADDGPVLPIDAPGDDPPGAAPDGRP